MDGIGRSIAGLLPRLVSGLITGALVFVGVAALLKIPESEKGPIAGAAYVVDGDSLEIAGRRLRLEGIDAPELHQTCRIGDQPTACGSLARAHLIGLIGAAEVHCQAVARDKYDRLLARCRVGDRLLNRRMVADGWAVAFGDFKDLEALARRRRRGLWQGEFERPSHWRDNNARSGNKDAENAGPSVWR